MFWYRDHWIVSSNSHVDANDATLHGTSKNAREIFDECAKASKLDYGRLNKSFVYMFEMVHPETRLVTPHTQCQLYHIATRNMNTLQEIPLFSPLADIGIPKPSLHRILYRSTMY